MTFEMSFWFGHLLENGVKIASLGGIEAIIEAMSIHKDHNGVQEWACAALGNLASSSSMFCL